MLKRLDPFLGRQRPATLRSSRQGKRIVRVDARFRASVPVTRLDDISAVGALNAALSVMRLSNVVAEAVWQMAVVGDADQERPLFAEFQPFIARRGRPRTPLPVLERSAFDKSMRKSFRSGCHGRKAALPQRSHQEGRHSS